MPLVCVAPLPSPGGPCAAPIGALVTCARFLPPMLGFFPPDPCPDGALTAYHWPDVWPSRYVREHEPSHGWIRDCAAIEARRSAAFDAGRREGGGLVELVPSLRECEEVLARSPRGTPRAANPYAICFPTLGEVRPQPLAADMVLAAMAEERRAFASASLRALLAGFEVLP